MTITIDGPAGTGKSTVARGLARRLQFAYLDTGAMYRAVALACLRRGLPLDDQAACAALAEQIEVHVDGQRTWLDGEDVTDAIRTPETTAAASLVAQIPAVRAGLVRLQQSIASRGDYVCEGRDQGTAVFPLAEVKFFMTAAPEVRAERRRQELLERGEAVSLADLLRQQTERDQRDQERAIAPLRPADDALLVDTTELTTEQVMDRMEGVVRERMAKR